MWILPTSMATSVRSTVRGTYPRIPFDTIAAEILGTHYEVSVLIAGDTLSSTLNKKHRGKTYAPNVLSFPLSKNTGEIVLNPRASAREAARFNHSEREHFCFLYIHGLLHLKGFDHGRAMERLEEAHLRRFSR